MHMQYPVREDLKKALPGPYYQVLVALSHMLEALRTNRRFNIMLELEGVGALDDVVICYFDDSRQNITNTFYIQQKHASDDEEELDEGDLRNKSGRCEIFKYFDDWFLFIGNQGNSKCIYYTNRDFCNELKQSNNFVTSNGCHIFSPKFFRGGKGSFYAKIVELIKGNSVICNETLITTASKQKISKNPTYEAANRYYMNGGAQLTAEQADAAIRIFLEHYYCLMVGQEHVEQLEKTVAAQVAQYFPRHADAQSVFNALIVETWQWFRVLGQAKVWNEDIVRQKLDEFKTRYLTIPSEFGISLAEIGHQLKDVNPLILRQQIRTKLKESIESNNQIIVLPGIAKTGKSTSMAHYLLSESSLKTGEYLYFPSPERFFAQYATLVKVDCLKIFIVDQIEDNNQQLQTAIQTISTNAKRLILLSRSKIEGYYTIEIPLLSDEDILNYIIQQKKQEYHLIIGDKRICLMDIVNLRKGGLYEQMRYPQNLKQFCHNATPPAPVLHSPRAVPKIPYHTQQRTITPIELDAEIIIPLYTLENVIQLNEFKGSKCCTFKSPEEMNAFRSAQNHSKAYFWVEFNTLGLSEDPHIMLNLSQLISERLSSEHCPSYNNGSLTLCIVDRDQKLKLWPKDRLHTLFQIPNIVIFSYEKYNEAAHNFSLKKQNKTYLLEYESARPFGLPSGNAITTRLTLTSLHSELKQYQLHAQRTVIMSVGGSGKSTTLKMLYKDHIHSNSLQWAGHYHHIVFIPLSRLVNLNLNNLSDIISNFLSNNPIFIPSLEADLSANRILFLIDGWDEINSTERNKIKDLLLLLAGYGHFILTTRPLTNLDDLFFIPAAIYQLQPLNSEQIRKFFNEFFKNDARSDISKEFVEQGIAYLGKPENQLALKMIGLPLQCYLLCESWLEAFELRCQGIEVEAPWTIPILHHIELYQRYVISQLRKMLYDQYHISRVNTLIAPQEICGLGNRHLFALQEAAYQQLFRGKPIILGNDWFSKQIERMSLIGNQEFEHKTYAEYFAALYLVNLLISNRIRAYQVIFEFRYQSNYLSIFEFMASIVSYGDPSIPTAQSCIKLFWDALLQHPRDRITIMDTALVKACYISSNKEHLTSVFNERDISAIDTLINTKPAVPPSPAKTEFHLSIARVAEVNNSYSFIEPKQIGTWHVVNANYIYTSLPVSLYNIDEKHKALKWLLEKCRTTTGFKVREACVKKLGDLGIATNEVITILTKFLSENLEDPRSTVKDSTVKALIALGVNLSQLNLSENDCKTFMQILVKDQLIMTQSNWLSLQTLSDAQLNILLDAVSKATIVIQQQIIGSLISLNKDSFFKKARTIIRENGQWNTFICCIKYELLKHKIIPEDDYFLEILKLEFSDETLSIVMALLAPMTVLFHSEIIAEKYKHAWGIKVLEFTSHVLNLEKHRVKIRELFQALAELNVSREKIANLLQQFFVITTNWYIGQFYRLLLPLSHYFDQSYANFIIDKLSTSNDARYLNDLIQIDKLNTDESQKLMVKTCLTIAEKNIFPKNIQAFDSDQQENPAYYVQSFSPRLVCQEIVLNLNESTIHFLRAYLRMTKYAITIQSDSAKIYTSSGLLLFPITEAQWQLLNTFLTAQTLLLTDGVVPEQPRPPSPTTFLLEYPGTVLFKKNIHAKASPKTNIPNTPKLPQITP